MGRVPGDHPVPAGYCSTRHYPDPAGYYFKIWPDPGNFSRVGICYAAVFDARHCGVTRGLYLPTWCFAGESRWQSTTGRFKQSSDTAYSDVRIDR